MQFRQSMKLLGRRIFPKKSLILAAVPKSASQHMRNLIRTAGGKINQFRPGHNFVDRASLLASGRGHHEVVWGHVPADRQNVLSFAEVLHRPRCIVLIRSLPDTVVSYVDHINRKGSWCSHKVTGLLDAIPQWPVLSRSQHFDLVINFAVPWYIKFVHSWMYGHHDFPLQIYTFEEHTSRPAATAENVLRFAGFPINQQGLRSLQNPEAIPKVNFNKGVGGRGFSELSSVQLQRIRELIALVPEFCDNPLGSYLLSGYAELSFKVDDVVEQKKLGGVNPLLAGLPRSSNQAA